MADHKYIEKIVKNGKTRYFYTVEELNAYKKALSSKDEADKYIKSAYGEDKKVTNKNRDKLVKKINNDYKKTSKLMKKKGMAGKKKRKGAESDKSALRKRSVQATRRYAGSA